MNLLVTLLLLPYRWFANLVALREKRAMAFPAVLGVVCFVSVARAELEVLASRSIQFNTLSIVNNMAFYLQSAYAYALLACWFTGKPLERVAGIVVMGVFLGVFPPLFDMVIGGTENGYYRYVTEGFTGWSWTLVNPEYYSTGEAITLWVLTIALALYVLQASRSLVRGLGALSASYATVVFIAMGPSSFVSELLQDASPFPKGLWLSALTLTQLFLAQMAYLLVRQSLAARLWWRLVHATPFVALTCLGGALAEFFSPSGLTQVERLRFIFLAAWLIFQLCVVALVQNDALDARQDGRPPSTVTREDAVFFTVIGILLVLAVMLALPGLGAPMALFLCVSTLYSFDFYRAKRFFPANYKAEGVWGWSSFILGGSAQLSIAPTRSVSPPFLLASLAVFGGWSLFNAFKDYKDIRADHKAGHQTLYVLALRRGMKLRTLHRTLRSTLMAGLALPAMTLASAGVDWRGLAVVTGCAGSALYWTLGGPPRKGTVVLFLWCTTAYVLALTGLIEFELHCR